MCACALVCKIGPIISFPPNATDDPNRPILFSSFISRFSIPPPPFPLPFTGQWTRRREGGRKEKRPKEQYKIESADRLHEDQTSQKVLTFFPGGFFVEGTCLMGSRIETRNFISGIVFAVWDRLESAKKKTTACTSRSTLPEKCQSATKARAPPPSHL